MKSLANAINNLATAITKLAEKNNLSVYQPVPKTTTSNPYYGNVNITSTYVSKQSEGWHSLTASEKEQLYYIYKAIMEKGINPNYHDKVYDKVMDNLRNNWPTLHKPIEKLVALKEKTILNKKYYSYKKDIWNNK